MVVAMVWFVLLFALVALGGFSATYGYVMEHNRCEWLHSELDQAWLKIGRQGYTIDRLLQRQEQYAKCGEPGLSSIRSLRRNG
jgi:hypothetical protein